MYSQYSLYRHLRSFPDRQGCTPQYLRDAVTLCIVICESFQIRQGCTPQYIRDGIHCIARIIWCQRVLCSSMCNFSSRSGDLKRGLFRCLFINEYIPRFSLQWFPEYFRHGIPCSIS
ncbi:UNVERIFIED_CONTAM: hypothetical protein Sradi_1373400 [Sesamum radiatum]|uniref:Uncharacterized protein n=1 Tax=Sesamum radiatum TaxID=300843 RepID=A0AAW2URE3_SESRA